MATSSTAVNWLKTLLPSKKANEKGVSTTETFNASNTNNILSLPAYKEHLNDIFSNRTNLDSRALLQDLFRTDPDVSASVNAFLTVADTPLRFLVKDSDNQVDMDGQKLLMQTINFLTGRYDYTKGFKKVMSTTAICEELRYMILLRGANGCELVINTEFLPTELRQVDMGKIEWFEKAPGQFTPQQRSNTGQLISLDIPNFFATWFRKDPTGIYSYSPFISAINTVAARQQVINDLYRIMNITGFPRLEITVLEEVVLKNAPTDVKLDATKQTAYLNTVMSEINAKLSNLRPDQAFTHYDSITAKVMNEKSSMALDISPIIEVLNGQNQAGLRTMATILGRGTSGVNTATVEARVFSMNATAINKPIADILSQAFTLALRLQGSESRVYCEFDEVEMRSEMELEPNKTMRATRLKNDLSDGIISDAEYTLKMYGRLPLDGAPLLSGTGFMKTGAADQGGASTKTTDQNAGPLDRAAQPASKSAPARDNAAGANKVK